MAFNRELVGNPTTLNRIEPISSSKEQRISTAVKVKADSVCLPDGSVWNTRPEFHSNRQMRKKSPSMPLIDHKPSPIFLVARFSRDCQNLRKPARRIGYYWCPKITYSGWIRDSRGHRQTTLSAGYTSEEGCYWTLLESLVLRGMVLV